MKRMLVMMTGVATALLAGCAKNKTDSGATVDPYASGATPNSYTTTTAPPAQPYYGQTSDPYASTGYQNTGSGYTSTGSTGSPAYNSGGSYQTTGDAGYAQQQPSYYDTATTPAYGGGGGSTHVVQKGDTLFSLARQYYNGDMSRWRDIYKANQGRYPNPDVIPVGASLVIP